jgi:hypothetical protein
MNKEFQHSQEQLKQRTRRSWLLPRIGRRMFFRHAAAAVGGYFFLPARPGETVARAAATPIGKARNVIFVFMNGAPSHTDTFDFKEGKWTPAFMEPTSYGDLRFPRGLMPNLADTIQDLAFVRPMRAHATAHGLAQTWMQLGRNPVPGPNRIAPHIGSVVAHELGSKALNKPVPAFVSLNAANGPGAGFLPPSDAPFYVAPTGAGLNNMTNPDGAAALDRRAALALKLDGESQKAGAIGGGADDADVFRAKARSMMYDPVIDSIFNFDGEARSVYGNSNFGNACLVARNLLKADVGARFIQISFGSWDHHGNIYAPNANLQLMARQFDAGLGALIRDLKADGTFDSTLIVALGEFGRTVGPLTAGQGRDHFPQQAALVTGAGVRGGRAIGSTNAAGDRMEEAGWSADRTIWAEDMEATIHSALGIDWTKVIVGGGLGRGFEFVPTTDIYQYQPVHELW